MVKLATRMCICKRTMWQGRMDMMDVRMRRTEGDGDFGIDGGTL